VDKLYNRLTLPNSNIVTYRSVMQKVNYAKYAQDLPQPLQLQDNSDVSSQSTPDSPQFDDLDDLWKLTKEHLRLKSDDKRLLAWFKTARLEDFKNGVARISVVNNYHKEWIETLHADLIADSLAQLTGVKPNIIVEIKRVQTEKPKYEYHDPTNTPQTSFISSGPSKPNSKISVKQNPHLNPRYKLSNFVIGSNNQIAVAIAQNIIDSPGRVYNPLFVYGPSGVGKTHLMQAIGNELISKDPDFTVLYIEIENFMNEMIESIRTQKTQDFRKKYRDVDMLLIDDIQFISTKEKTKEELFNTFNALYQNNKQIIIASDKPPQEIENLPDRLKTRFMGGMVIDMHLPDYETRLAIIKQRLEGKKAFLSYEVQEFIAQQIEGSVRELEGAINRVISTQEILGKQIPIDEVAKLLHLDIESKRKRISPDKIMQSVCKIFDVTPSEIKSKRRTAYIAKTRQVIMYLLRKDLEYPLEKIAQFVNRKDHTTVLHAYDKIEGLLEEDTNFAEKIASVRALYN